MMNLHEELFKAVENGDIARVKELLKMGSSSKDVEGVVKARDGLGNTLLHIAAYKGYKEIVATLLDYARTWNFLWVNEGENVFNDTPLHKASINGHADVVELLLKHGAHVDATSWYGSTPLHYAAYNGHANIVKLLLENCADPSVENNIGKKPADVARERGHIEIAKMIEDVKELFEALKKGDTSKAEKLLVDLRVPNARDRNGVSLLHWATFIGHPGIVRFLIEKGADVNIKDWKGNTPLHYAAKIGDAIIAKLLLEKGADINAKDNHNCTPLHYAANVEVARLLIEKGADINAKSEWYDGARASARFHELIINKEGRAFLGWWISEDYLSCAEPLTPLHFAAIKGDAATVKLLIEKGSDVNSKTLGGITTLHLAAVSGNVDVARLLLEVGADVNARDDMGRTPLHYASNASVAKMLIEAGADINARDKEGVTPLHYAAHRCWGARGPFRDVVKTLLEYGADVNAKTTFGVTPLHVAAYYGEAEIVEMLIKRGADVNARTSIDRGAFTPLHYCSSPPWEGDPLFGGVDYALMQQEDFVHARCECITLLAKHGANVNAIDASGRTPLHYAVKSASYFSGIPGISEVLEVLLRYDAHVNVKDKDGNTPLHYALNADGIVDELSFDSWWINLPNYPVDIDIVKLLLENGADPSIRNNQGISVLDLAEMFTRDADVPESQRVCGRMIKEFWVKSRSRLVSSGRGSDAVTVVCPYCGRPGYRLVTLGRYYCFNCKRYV
jgi:ankyrin repeat protein